jgi:hypothetical protein
MCPSCGGHLQHVNWRGDRRAVDHQLRPGQRYFRDGTPAEALAFMRHRIKSFAAQGHVVDEATKEKLLADAADPEGKTGEFQKGWPMVCREPDTIAKILADGGLDG